MTKAPASLARMTFTTELVPRAQRLDVLREAVWQPYHQIHLNHRDPSPLHSQLSLLALPATHVQHGVMTAAELRRQPGGADEHWVLIRYEDGPVHVQSGGHRIDVPQGGAALFRTTKPVQFLTPASRYVCVGARRDALEPLFGHSALPAVLAVPDSDALGLLCEYALALARTVPAAADPALLGASARHLQELLSLAVRQPPTGQGLDGLVAAQLQRAKSLVAAHQGDPAYSVVRLAATLRLSPRYLQRLFEREGTTFSRYLREQRLQWAHARLSASTAGELSIGRIALDAGFADSAYFNRCFRQRFQSTPGEVRRQAWELRAEGN